MYIKRLLHSQIGKGIVSILLGLGLATLFRKVCNDRNCLVFKGPEIDIVDNKIFKQNGKCYKFNKNNETCKETVKTVINF